MNLVYVGDFVLSYLLNPTTYRHETCTTGYTSTTLRRECKLTEVRETPYHVDFQDRERSNVTDATHVETIKDHLQVGNLASSVLSL